MSARRPTFVAVACSGAMYCGVPVIMPVAVRPPWRLEHLRDPEVGEVDAAALVEEDVLRLDVAVDEALACA